ncbi:54S ribosomal protein L38, mitochondrial [Erysiphe necator]|nr:54S ribosomal protein L38, mitochondrial [Erysiphe necator]
MICLIYRELRILTIASFYALNNIKMIQLKTMLNCIDNSGAAIVECVKVMRMKRHARIGDRIIVVVQKQRNFGPESGPGASVSTTAANKVRRGDIRHAVVVRTANKTQRSDGSVVKFDDNACVLINKTGEPIGTRLNGQISTLTFFIKSPPLSRYRCCWI